MAYEFDLTRTVNGKQVKFDFMVKDEMDGKDYLKVEYEARDGEKKTCSVGRYGQGFVSLREYIVGMQLFYLKVPKKHTKKLDKILQNKMVKNKAEKEKQFRENLIFYHDRLGEAKNGTLTFEFDWKVNVFNTTISVKDDVETYLSQKYPACDTKKSAETLFHHFTKLYFIYFTYLKEEIDKLKEEIFDKYKLTVQEKERNGRYFIAHISGSLESWDKVFDEVYGSCLKEIEEKIIREKQEQEKLKQLKQKAIKKAKAIGDMVIIKKIFTYNGDSPKDITTYGNEWIIEKYRLSRADRKLGQIDVYLVAYPDGTIKEEHIPFCKN